MFYENRQTEPRVDDIVGYYLVNQDNEHTFYVGVVTEADEQDGSIKIDYIAQCKLGNEIRHHYLCCEDVSLIHRQDEVGYYFIGVK